MVVVVLVSASLSISRPIARVCGIGIEHLPSPSVGQCVCLSVCPESVLWQNS